MTALEYTITRIIQLHTSGKTPQEIAQELPTSKREQRYEQIKQAIEKGAPTVEAIAEQTGLKPKTIRQYASEAEIDLPSTRSKYTSLQTRLTQLQHAITEVDTFEELCARIDLAPSTICGYLNKHHIPTPFPIPTVYLCGIPRRRPEIDKLIEQGLSLQEIADHAKFSHQRASQYILGTKQYDAWKAKRKEKKQELEQRTALITSLAGILKEHTLNRAHNEEDWTTAKALEKVHSYKTDRPQNFPFEYVYAVLSAYEQARKKGEKLSLEELGQTVEICPMSARKILLDAGVHAMHRTNNTKRTPPHKKQAIERSRNLHMSAADIGYFIDTPTYVVDVRWRMQGQRETHRCLKSVGTGKKLTYRHASQVYEATDAGFTLEETTKLLNSTPKIVDYALQNRTSIEPELIEMLKVIYDDKKIDKPYWRKF